MSNGRKRPVITRITARFASTCSDCGEDIYKGDTVYYCGVTLCADCGEPLSEMPTADAEREIAKIKAESDADDHFEALR